MANFYATYSPASASGAVVTANQGTSPWIVAGGGTAGTAATGVVTVQGIAGGTAIPISGSITATNPSVGATGAAVPASGTYVAASVAGTLTGLVATAAGLKVDGSAATQPVSGTVAATQSGVWNITNVSGTVSLPTGAATEVTLGALNTKVPSQGQALMAASVPVVIASNQTAIPISGTATVSGTVAATQSGTWNIGTVTTVTGVTTVSTVTTVGAVTAITNALPAGSNIIGNVRIDQTTPGTTNGVQVNAALPAGSNIIGNFRIDQTTPGTTNGVVVNTIAPVTTTTAVFQAEGAVAFGSITNSFATLFTPTAATKMVQLRNNTNAAIAVSMDGGSTTNYIFDAGDALSLDLLANSLNMGATAIQVKYAVGAPTSGSFRINGCH